MYRVIEYFTDLHDDDHEYREGDVFPREGIKVSKERLEELEIQKDELTAKIADEKLKNPSFNEGFIRFWLMKFRKFDISQKNQRSRRQSMLEDLKLLLGLEDTDKKTEQQLQLILNATKQRLKFLLGGLEPPEEMEYIILDVSVIRFNRIGSEGLSSHSVEGESLSWSENDFAGYMDDIQSYLDSQREARKGKVKFL